MKTITHEIREGDAVVATVTGTFQSRWRRGEIRYDGQPDHRARILPAGHQDWSGDNFADLPWRLSGLTTTTTEAGVWAEEPL